MHNNYYFLGQLSASLNTRLKGYTVVSCFSQNKEELIIELNNEKESFFIKAHLLSSLCCLSFPNHFSRAKKNSVDLFNEVILKRFVGTTQFNNERSFALHFEKNISLIFKMHGNRSNVLLVQNEIVTQIFRNQFKADLNITPASLNKPIDWSEEFFKQHQHELKEAYFTLGKEVWGYLTENGFEKMEHAERWVLFNATLKILEEPIFYVVEQNHKVKLTLIPYGGAKSFNDPIDAINEFFFLKTSTDTLQKEKQVLQKKLTTSLDAYQAYITKSQRKLEEIRVDTHYKIWADVLMANLHLIERGSKNVTLTDFNGDAISIKLKPELNAQKNAEIYYRKSKNQEIETNKLSQSIAQKEKDIESINAQLRKLNEVKTVTELRLHFKENKSKKNIKEEILPFHQTEYKGWKIWIGKNAINNDLLTLKYTHKDDLWLHAKDVAGSHVVVKNQSGKIIPKEVIERAAELAAYNSKRKSETLCPVAYTQKKFVRKRKGDPPGAVVVEREEVIMVTPKLM